MGNTSWMPVSSRSRFVSLVKCWIARSIFFGRAWLQWRINNTGRAFARALP
jgi:hypothetical protein